MAAVLPNTSSYGVNLVAVCGVVLYTNIAYGTISSQLDSSSDMKHLRYSFKVLWDLSKAPFVSGWNAVEVKCFILKSLQLSVNILEVNSVPRSVRTVSGAPYIVTKLLIRAFATVTASLFLRGVAPENFVKSSWKVIMYLFPASVSGSGPTMSKAILWKEVDDVSVSLSGTLVPLDDLLRLQILHEFTYFFMSCIIFGQTYFNFIL